MDDSIENRQRVASLLLDSGCVSMQGEEPFRLPSGWASPAYIDCRRLIAFPEARNIIVQACVERLLTLDVVAMISEVVACETSGIAFGAWIAERLNLPLHYVRKKPRGIRHVEGNLLPGKRVLLIDDMMAAGTSKLNFLHALADSDSVVKDLLVIFDYAALGAENKLLRHGVRTHSMATWHDILKVAEQRSQFSERSLNKLSDFLADPSEWSLQHGGLSA